MYTLVVISQVHRDGLFCDPRRQVDSCCCAPASSDSIHDFCPCICKGALPCAIKWRDQPESTVQLLGFFRTPTDVSCSNPTDVDAGEPHT